MRTHFPLLLITLLSSFSAFATDTELKKTLVELRTQYEIPGIAAAFIQNNEIQEITTAGVRKNGNETLMETTDKFHLGSCGKSMTATIVAMFVEEKKLDWKSTLKELLPHVELHADYSQVTLEMLTSHRSGISRDIDGFEGIDPVVGRKLVAETFLTQPAYYEVGKFNYSNIGYMVVGHILETISGESWEELMRKKLFIPLAMNSCGFGPTSNPALETPDQPWGHVKTTLQPIHDDNPPTFGPAGTINCNLLDWGKYLKMHLNGFNGKDGLVTADTFKKLHTVYPDVDSEYTYGGWFLFKRIWAKGTVLTHQGTNTYNFANVWIAPAKEAILMSTSNLSGARGHTATDSAITDIITRRLKQ